MRTILEPPKPVARKSIAAEKRSVEKLIAPLDEIAANSNYLLAKPLASFKDDEREHHVPRYLFLGPKGGGDTIRIGVFATLHGDEPEGALALVRFLTALEKNPE